MKFKSIILSLLAGAALLSACAPEYPVSNPELAISLNPSLLVFDGKAAEEVDIEVTAAAAWSVEVPASIDWVSISPTSGSTGTTKVKVSVLQGGESARTAEIPFKAGKDTKLLTVNQEGGTVWGTVDNPYTCAKACEFCATLADKAKGPKQVYVKGIISSIIEKYGTAYGNATFFMSDDGSTTAPQFEVYRAYYYDNKKYSNEADQNISVGDEVVLYGYIMNYGGQAETSQYEAYLISLTAGSKPSLTCAAKEVTQPFGATAASFAIEANNIAAGWTASTDAAWITDYTKSGNGSDKLEVSFPANDVAEARTAVFTVKADGVEDLVLTLTQEAYTDITDITCAELNAKEDGSALFRVKGVILDIVMDKDNPDQYNKYGNFHIADETGVVYVYGLLPEAGGAKKQDVLTQKGIKVGDVITVVGPKGSHNGDPQMVNAYYESHVPVTTTTAAAFNELPDGAELFLIKGTVKEIVMDKDNPDQYNKYGNLYVEDETGTVYVYGVVPVINGKSKQDILTTRGVKVGDVVTVVGPKGSYKGNPQMLNAYLAEVASK